MEVAYCSDTGLWRHWAAGRENTARNRRQEEHEPRTCTVLSGGRWHCKSSWEQLTYAAVLIGKNNYRFLVRRHCMCSSVLWCKSTFQLIIHISKFQVYVDVSTLRNVFLSWVPILLNKVFLLPPAIVRLWGGQCHCVITTACVKQTVGTYTVHYTANTAHNNL